MISVKRICIKTGIKIIICKHIHHRSVITNVRDFVHVFVTLTKEKFKDFKEIKFERQLLFVKWVRVTINYPAIQFFRCNKLYQNF